MLYIQKLPKYEVPETHVTHSMETCGIHMALTHGYHLVKHVALISVQHITLGVFHPEQAQFSEARSPKVPKYLNDKSSLIQV